MLPINTFAGNITFFLDDESLVVYQMHSFLNLYELDSICKMVDYSSVKSIDLSDADELTKIPASFYKFITIRRLTITSYTIEKIDNNLIAFKKLETLNLHCYSLKNFEGNIKLPPNINELSIVVNSVEMLDAFCGLNRLKEMRLDLGQFYDSKVINKIKCQKKLTYLSISNFPYSEEEAEDLLGYFDKDKTQVIIHTKFHKEFSNIK
jgi:hypothetical protein